MALKQELRMTFGRRSQLRLARGAMALVVALSVFVSVALGGHRYFYCSLMDRVSLDACCDPPAHPDGDGGAGLAAVMHLTRSDCCSAERFATPSPAVRTPPAALLRAPVVALVPVDLAARTSPESQARTGAHAARAGPPPRDGREHRLRLMISLT